MSSYLLLAFPMLVSLVSMCLCCLCSLISQTSNCARLLIVATPVLKSSRPKVQLHGNNVCDIIIVRMISENAQTNRPAKCKANLEPHVKHVAIW